MIDETTFVIEILLLYLLDGILTYYQFFLDKKKGTVNFDREKVFVAKWIFKKTNLKPYGFLISSLPSFVFIFFWLIFIPNIFILYLALAFQIVVNYDHIKNIWGIKRNWDNKDFWKKRAEVK